MRARTRAFAWLYLILSIVVVPVGVRRAFAPPPYDPAVGPFVQDPVTYEELFGVVFPAVLAIMCIGILRRHGWAWWGALAVCALPGVLVALALPGSLASNLLPILLFALLSVGVPYAILLTDRPGTWHGSAARRCAQSSIPAAVSDPRPATQPSEGSAADHLTWRCECGEVNIRSHAQCRVCGTERAS